MDLPLEGAARWADTEAAPGGQEAGPSLVLSPLWLPVLVKSTTNTCSESGRQEQGWNSANSTAFIFHYICLYEAHSTYMMRDTDRQDCLEMNYSGQEKQTSWLSWLLIPLKLYQGTLLAQSMVMTSGASLN